MQPVPGEIFKAYDIRGVAGKTLSAKNVETIGQAIGSEAIARGHREIVAARDGRLSGPELVAALIRGLTRSGIDVIDVGCVTTPMAYFAAHHLGTQAAVMLTGSHNPPEYNGLKIVIGGQALYGAAIQSLRQRIERGELHCGAGRCRQQDIADAYLDRIASDVSLARPMRIAVDCGNGIAGAYAARLYRRLGCSVEELYCEVDGRFPNHHPDPSVPENLLPLIAALEKGDSQIGLAFDGDGDRLGVVTADGATICPDRLLMLFSADLLDRHPGAEIIFDIKCTRNLFDWIGRRGGKATIWKSGHSLIKAKMLESGALLAAEMTGHLFFAERWYGFDDGLYAGARLLEILSRADDIARVFNELPDSCATPELHIKTSEGCALLELIKASAVFSGAREVIALDGLRVEYADGFGLLRPSNTTPALVLRFEGDNEAAMARIQGDFRRIIKAVAPNLALPF